MSKLTQLNMYGITDYISCQEK